MGSVIPRCLEGYMGLFFGSDFSCHLAPIDCMIILVRANLQTGLIGTDVLPPVSWRVVIQVATTSFIVEKKL